MQQGKTSSKSNYDIQLALKHVHLPMVGIMRRLRLWTLTEGFLFSPPKDIDVAQFSEEIEKSKDDALISLALMDVTTVADWTGLIDVLRGCESMFEDKTLDEKISLVFDASITSAKKWGTKSTATTDASTFEVSLIFDEPIEKLIPEVGVDAFFPHSIYKLSPVQMSKQSSFPEADIRDSLSRLCLTEVFITLVHRNCFDF